MTNIPLPSLPKTWPEDWQDFDAWRRAIAEKPLFGVPTGIPSLDAATRGLAGLVVIPALPGAGKTCLALQIGTHAAEQGHVLLYISTEMLSHFLYARTLARLAKIDFWDVVNQPQPKKTVLDQAVARARAFWDRVYIADIRSAVNAALSLWHVEQWIIQIGNRHGVAPIVVIDHAQDIEPGRQFLGLKERMDFVAVTLAQFASLYRTTVIAISEKNRASYGLASMGSSMGSASWEYKADALINLETEDERTAAGSSGRERKRHEHGGNALGPRRVDLVIVKQRVMPPTTVSLKFYAEMSMFTSQ